MKKLISGKEIMAITKTIGKLEEIANPRMNINEATMSITKSSP